MINHAGFFLSHRLPIAVAAMRAGYEVHVATPRSKHVPRLIDTGLSWHPIRLSRSGRNPVREMVTLWDLMALYRRLRPDLVHHVSTKPVLYGTIAARLTRVPSVVNAISGLGHAFVAGGFGRQILRDALATAYRRALRHPHMRVIFQNREQKDDFVSQARVREEECVIIPGSGVDMTLFRPAAQPHREVAQVLLTSRMLYTKGVRDFVEAARILRDRGAPAEFNLVGEPDPDNPESIPLDVLQAWDRENLVHYRGRSDEMPAVFAETDIVCLPTYYGEGVPKVLIEAAACGLPIVTTDWPGCRDVVADGVNGFLVPIKAPDRLAAALERLITNRGLRETMGVAGRARVEKDFSLDHVMGQTLAVYEELLR